MTFEPVPGVVDEISILIFISYLVISPPSPEQALLGVLKVLAFLGDEAFVKVIQSICKLAKVCLRWTKT